MKSLEEGMESEKHWTFNRKKHRRKRDVANVGITRRNGQRIGREKYKKEEEAITGGWGRGRREETWERSVGN